MAEEILINATPQEVRAALVSDGVLQEIYIERNLQPSVLGNIYKGKVHRLLPGMQAAFIDIGFERAAFLHASDIQANTIPADIRDLLRQGQEILVQVYKDSLGTKGVRVTTQFTIPSRYLVFTPGIQQIAVSQRINDEVTRERLLKMLTPEQAGGYIFRTAAATAELTDIIVDKEFLQKEWQTILSRGKQAKVGELVYADVPVILRLLRDLATESIAKIRIDKPDIALEMQNFAKRFAPKLMERIEYHDSKQPIFDIYAVEAQLQKALQRKVYLKSGGYLIFDQTEAMTTIDVNTGSYLGRGDPEETVFKTNNEAVEIIARQVRLRNLGGIIIIDFIDMSDPEHKTKLIQSLRNALSYDSARTELSELSSLGLVQMTRKRTRESLERVLCVPCPVCHAKGTVKSLETMSYEILRELQGTAKNFAWPGFLIVAAAAVVNYLLAHEERMLSEIELALGKPVKLQVESSYTQERYDILPMSQKE
jgi:ribonuclease G